MRTYVFAGLALAGLALAACGVDKTDRALSGAGIGAVVGTVGAVVVGANPLAGALVGAGTGVVAGVVTTPDQINLGTPIWRDPDVYVPGS